MISYENKYFVIMLSICMSFVLSHLSFSLSVNQFSPELLASPFIIFNQI